ncbi:MAG: ComEC/Rec2 family competence protein [Elusimicrobia bacterium]|nr:ComEC/Rec2 family competence protein [Elusimicrobiota bacterium]
MPAPGAVRSPGPAETGFGASKPRVSKTLALETEVVSPCVETHQGDRLTALAPDGRRVEVYLAAGSCDGTLALPGAIVRFEGKERPPRPAALPGDFDEAALLESRGASSIVYARRATESSSSPRWTRLAANWAERARRSAHRAFRRRLAPDDARLLEGLLFGYKGKLSPKLRQEAQDAGVIHLLVPSGAKVGFVVWSLSALVFALGASKRASIGAAVLVGAFYCLAVGAESPYLRAYAAALAGLAACFWPGRESGGLQAIALSALVLLAFWPHALFSAGFQMTYAAAIALWLSVPRWRLRTGPAWLRSAAQVLGVSLAVQLALWPILANVFGRGSAAGLLANVLLVPAAGFYMGGGVVLWFADSWNAAGHAAAGLMTAALGAFKGTCAFFASLPGAAFDLPRMDAWEVASWYAASVAAFLLPEWRRSIAPAGLALALWAGSAAAAWAEGPRLEVCLMADRRGHAAWARLPGGETVLVDAGLPPSRLQSALRALGGRPPSTVGLTEVGPRATRGLRALGEVPVRARGPVELDFGRFFLRFGEQPGVAVLRGSKGGPIEFCILRHPAAVAPAECFPAGIRGAGFEGAVWIITDGKRYEIADATPGRPLRRPLL